MKIRQIAEIKVTVVLMEDGNRLRKYERNGADDWALWHGEKLVVCEYTETLEDLYQKELKQKIGL